MHAQGLLLNEHVDVAACRQLLADGVDVVHALEVGPAARPARAGGPIRVERRINDECTFQFDFLRSVIR
jgi:hypothetical protein